MRYTVTTFKVRLEMAEVGDRSGEPDDVELTKRLKERGEMLGFQDNCARAWFDFGKARTK